MTVLLTGLVVLLAALAGSTIALLHLHAATHAERSQRARVVARSGLELVDALLADRVAASGGLPAVPPPLPTGHGLDLRIVGYRLHDDATVEVEVQGREAGAVASAGARLRYP